MRTLTDDLTNLYGPTETTIWSTAAIPSGGAGAPPIGASHRQHAYVRVGVGAWSWWRRVWWGSCTSRGPVWPAAT
ncbi:hypothetical protein LV779_36115 [Streptomyces thinghirensis]|nr:hypothetical protein [Streptomyces thinghirensis]